MRRCFAVSLSCASLLAALAALPGVAAAAQHARPVRHAVHARVAHYAPTEHYAAPPLTVRKRSFLDPGNVVPVFSSQRYVAESTIYNRTTDQLFARSKFGSEALPTPNYWYFVPGRPQPLFVFSTGGW